MPIFQYAALDAKQNTVQGKVDQPDRASAIAAIIKEGLRPIKIKEQTAAAQFGAVRKKNITLFESNRVKNDDLVIMTRQLSAMVAAGVPLLKAISSLAQYTQSHGLKIVLSAVIKDVEGGSSLADALKKHPNVFNDVYVNMVRAGEAAGILDEILKRLAQEQEKNASIRKKIRSAMVYPVTLLVVTTAAFFGLMIFVVPSIGKIIKDMSGGTAELPAITQFMLNISSFVTSFWYIIILGAIAFGFLFINFIKSTKGRIIWHTVLLKTPFVKGLIMKIAVARFTRTFSALLGAGVAVLECLHVTSKSVGNALFEKALLDAAEEVKNGKQLSIVISNNPIFPPIVSQMMAVGEETGQTDAILVKVADFYEEEVDVAVSGLSSIIEPAMIIVMGGMVGLIAASVMLPIASISQSIK